jgi:hypothetical protein
MRSYGEGARLLEAFGHDIFGVTSVASITPDHIQTSMAEALERWKPTTCAMRCSSSGENPVTAATSFSAVRLHFRQPLGLRYIRLHCSCACTVDPFHTPRRS